ncbi:CheR family methyltransferase [Burkholderia multivorans]|uniref:CheR family methyltransferase n=1 Tax=Burkholderia multivorans TaxID=87883 RepID=UPI00285D7A54|nr:protein-glutamate O-methyltransferase CheR [Burkholderia multivorans]MDR9096151.1 Chemotaxis protein methyltransferase [Burkholderia multivorans]MDR9119924.1 Chemotaxis protein methyltransferase [Burkholderia multivorans]MDR9160191.1 Chemotaxis protein methyltransferase [Burkholderia multivorans]MDR9166742.1 Chemotaxis protein methyltransferase [Burkholderia multivorans]MDR9253221.1 Chemotaxis protein methyltransferase [Burkholderia multivorans]
MAEIVITDEDFQKFREFFYRKTGILFEDSKRYFVDKRLVERIEATGHAHFRSYFTFVRFQASGEELQALINAMTVNETYFFREEYQFKCLVDSMLPEIVRRKKPGSTIRIWSIPSSSGEEPYSIALYLTDFWPDIERWDVELISSDIDTDMLQKARQGKYSPRSVQHLPANFLQKHFKRLPDGNYQIADDLRQSVEFTRVNLNDPGDARPYRGFDVVFCRNLLIYFDDLSRRQAAEVFFDALNPGGFICLGHSESMSRITSLFKVRKFPGAIVYQKPEER